MKKTLYALEIFRVVSNSSNKTHNVGELNPNGFGLYDMSGNVWEWCSDWLKVYPGSSGVFDYTGHRVYRGGSWSNRDRDCRLTKRDHDTPSSRYYLLGFRVCFTLQ